MNKMIAVTLAAGAIMSAGVTISWSHGSATGIVAERMNGMMMLSQQIKLLNPMLTEGAQPDLATVENSAKMISDHAGRAMLDLFPEGSIEGPSEAKPEIWERWIEFKSLAERLQALGIELGKVAIVKASAPEPKSAVESSRPLSEWEKLDTAVLLGLKTKAKRELELAGATNHLNSADSVPRAREPKVVFSEIAATCSACHSAFRR